jgi:hypothetical protein
MIGKNDKYKKQKCHMCLQKAIILSLVMISIRNHCTGHPTKEPPKRSWDPNHIALKSIGMSSIVSLEYLPVNALDDSPTRPRSLLIRPVGLVLVQLVVLLSKGRRAAGRCGPTSAFENFYYQF